MSTLKFKVVCKFLYLLHLFMSIQLKLQFLTFVIKCCYITLFLVVLELSVESFDVMTFGSVTVVLQDVELPAHRFGLDGDLEVFFEIIFDKAIFRVCREAMFHFNDFLLRQIN